LPVDLDEGAGQLLDFPRRRRLASAKANDDVLHPHRLARLQSQVPDDAVALVQQTQHRDPLGHWRYPGLIPGSSWNVNCYGLIALRLALLGTVATGCKKRQCNRQEGRVAQHAYSGFQAS